MEKFKASITIEITKVRTPSIWSTKTSSSLAAYVLTVLDTYESHTSEANYMKSFGLFIIKSYSS